MVAGRPSHMLVTKHVTYAINASHDDKQVWVSKVSSQCKIQFLVYSSCPMASKKFGILVELYYTTVNV